MKEDISIVLSGAAGQGIKTVEKLLIYSLRNAGYHFFSTSELMSRVRGGNNTTEIRIGNKKIQAFAKQIDVLIVLGKGALDRVDSRINDNTIIVGEERFIPKEYSNTNKLITVPFMKIADEAGGTIMTNTVVLGYIFGMINLSKEFGEEEITKVFAKKDSEVLQNNIKAFHKGIEHGHANAESLNLQLPQYNDVKQHAIMCGTDAIGIGALAGGCNFMGAYPMSPGTGVLEFLAKNAEEFGVVVEQAEDEIAAVNMAIGAWYAGARGMTTTSGGGFALMEEGISLSGIIEIPVVVHIGMRPGPATGLPTRTEQGDLLFSVFAGHGEFPKIVLAPGNFSQAIDVTRKAFLMADQFKVPVILLSDQYLLESYGNITKPDFLQNDVVNHIIKTDANYKTYEVTNDGLSPRGVPSYGEGFVCADSDEHDELGRITESDEVRVTMMDKRMRKIDSILNHSIAPTVEGDENYSTLIVSWGSTYGVLSETFNTKTEGIAYAHFTQVYPLPPETETLISKAKRIVVVENNATGQFAKLLQMELGIKVHHKVLQYDGFPFSVELISEMLENEYTLIEKAECVDC